MIEKILNQLSEKLALEVQFRLSHKTIAKYKSEWIEVEGDLLSLTEWEDLKDICLQNTEKLTLETKGFVRGLFKTNRQTWSYSFTEHKECLKAYFNAVPMFNLASSIQSPLFWETIKNLNGMYIITGERGQGKSSLIKDILLEIKKDSPRLVAVHGQFSSLSMISNDSLIHLSEESFQWDTQHPIYDGIDLFVVDYNSIKNWDKWIKFCEEGRSVFITVSGLGITNCIEQIMTQLSLQIGLIQRFTEVVKLVCYQKVIGVQEGALQEYLILHNQIKSHFKPTELSQFFEIIKTDSFKKYYQSFNQSIIQALVRRKIDVKTAFKISKNPDELDEQLKRMGL